MGGFALPILPASRGTCRVKPPTIRYPVEISGSDLGYLVEATAPTLVNLFGVGTDVAGQLLVTAGDNPERLKSSAAFAHLCGVAPVPASSVLSAMPDEHGGQGLRHVA